MNYSEAGILLIDKPREWTSFDVVGKLRWAMTYHYGKRTRIGHAGTLDPLATGLLIICTGKETKNIHKFQGQEKEYTGTFFLGATTPSFDLETEINARFDISNLSETALQQAARSLTGKLLQEPPAHSAKWINGKRAYQYARAGKEVEMKKAEVEVREFDLTKIELPLVHFRVSCSKGTYIRSLARDLGEAVGSGAYLHSLVRTRIGGSTLASALKMEEALALFPAKFSRQDL